jgi:hypothetical protein
MIEFSLNLGGQYAHKTIDGVETGENHNVETSSEYLAWVAEGNTPNPYIPPPEPAPLTPQEKLAAAGLSVDDLKKLLGIN